MRIFSLDNEFDPCPMCRSKPGSPELCLQCLERRELLGVMVELQQAIAQPSARHLSLAKQVDEIVRICPQCKFDRFTCSRHGR